MQRENAERMPRENIEKNRETMRKECRGNTLRENIEESKRKYKEKICKEMQCKLREYIETILRKI